MMSMDQHCSEAERAITKRTLLFVLQESRRNQLKDFVHVAGPLGVTQFVILTATEHAAYLRLAKAPRVRLF